MALGLGGEGSQVLPEQLTGGAEGKEGIRREKWLKLRLRVGQL